MSTEHIAAITPVAQDGIPAFDDVAAAAPTKGPAFAEWVNKELTSVNQQMVQAEQGLQQLAAGGQVSLHEVMMRAEEARLSFQLLVQMRNKLLEAYQDVMRMQA